MNFFKANLPPNRVPTLTEVVDFVPATLAELDESAVGKSKSSLVTADPDKQPGGPPDLPPGQLPVMQRELPSQDELTLRVLADVQRQIDAMLEYRMKEVLAPVINRATDALARDARAELALVLKEVVTRAVTEEIARQQSK